MRFAIFDLVMYVVLGLLFVAGLVGGVAEARGPWQPWTLAAVAAVGLRVYANRQPA